MRQDLRPYEPALQAWLPKAKVETGLPHGPHFRIEWKTAGGKRAAFIAEVKRDVRTRDIRLVIAQLKRHAAGLRPTPRTLLLAPYIRREQAAELVAHGVNFIDLAGNAHVEAPGLLVHVEGKQPDPIHQPAAARLTKGWVRTVMVLLARPDLRNAPYRPIAAAGDVALGTVTVCLKDLQKRGFLRETTFGRQWTNLPDLLAIWVQAYVDMLRPRLKTKLFQIREVDRRERWNLLAKVLRQQHVNWALTGADAALVWTDFFEAAATEIYALPALVENALAATVTPLGQPARYEGNLRVIEPPAPIAIPTNTTETPVAPLLLVYAELRFKATEQAAEAADLLLPRLLAELNV